MDTHFFDEKTINDPHELFSAWLVEAEKTELNDANAMALATVSAAGVPSVRMVLLKDYSDRGFVFYTNRQSRKADDLRDNARASLLFHWKSLRRQVRVEGAVESVSDTEADAYFASRSRDSQLGAWASEQSRLMPGRAEFERRYAEMEDRFSGREVVRPAHWGGFRVMPQRLEFWLDRPHRLHERWVFERPVATAQWQRYALYP